MKRNCDICLKPYTADPRNIKRGWGLCCGKSCAAKKREMAKPGYDVCRVLENNIRRANWVDGYREEEGYFDDDPGWDAHKGNF